MKRTWLLGITILLLLLLSVAFFGYRFFFQGSEPVAPAPIEPSSEALAPTEQSTEPTEEPIAPSSTVALPTIFGAAMLTPDLTLTGSGTNIDSPEFFVPADPGESLLLVTAKGNDQIEVWPAPFKSEGMPLKFDELPNGIDVLDTPGLLLVGVAAKNPSVEVYSLPALTFVRRIGAGRLGSGETNLDTYRTPEGRQIVFVSESHALRSFDLETGEERATFEPSVESIEEVAADSYYRIIYVPDEGGGGSETNPGGAILAFHPDGRPYLRNGQSHFGTGGLFTGDEEGITIHPCLDERGADTGHGFIIVTDQVPGAENGFEFFNRETWKHLGTLRLTGVTNTDGITTTNAPIPGFPQGAFAAIDNDRSVAVVGWDKIYAATGLSCRVEPVAP